MKKIKSYTGIWNVEKVLYAINDFTLPFPVTFTPVSYTHLDVYKRQEYSSKLNNNKKHFFKCFAHIKCDKFVHKNHMSCAADRLSLIHI